MALPLLIAAEVIVHQHMRPIVGQLLQRGIVPPDARPRCHACVESVMRLRNSILAEVLLIAFVYTAGHQLWQQQLVRHTATWYASVVDSVLLLSPAGYWYAFVSIPIYQFIWEAHQWTVPLGVIASQGLTLGGHSTPESFHHRRCARHLLE